MSAPRQLPRRPNLDHLKNEAKTLHRAYVRGDPDAVARVRAAGGAGSELKLLDAQRVVAREYGFSKWAELRAAVQNQLTANAASPESSTHPLTTRTQIAIAIARGIAAAHGHDDAGAYHIALGVLREGENAAVAALQHADVPIRELRQALERALPTRGASARAGEALEASAAELALTELAKREAIERGVPFVANEHLVLALLRDPNSSITRMFADYGISYGAFSEHLDFVLSGG